MQRKGFQIRIWQWGLLAAIFVFWWAMTKPGFIPAFFFSDDSQAAFFFGEPVIILQRIWEWFAGGEIYSHLGVTLYDLGRPPRLRSASRSSSSLFFSMSIRAFAK